MDNRTPWEKYDDEIMSNTRYQEAPDLVRKYDESQSSSETKEELARQKEENTNAVKKFKFDKQDELTMYSIRRGRILSSGEFIAKLKTIASKYFFYRDAGQPGQLGLWVSDGFTEPQYTCWVQTPYMQEYSIMHIDDHGVALNEKFRGWRTPLLQLQLQGVITEAQAIELFGAATGPASFRYNRQLHGYRNRTQE